MLWADERARSSWWTKLRLKRWDFYAVHTEHFSVCVALIDFTYTGIAFITVYEQGKKPQTVDATISPWGGLVLSTAPLSGVSSYNSSDFSVYFNNEPRGKTVYAKHKQGILLNLLFTTTSSKQEGLLGLLPLNDDGAQYFVSNKQYNYVVNGLVKIGDNEYALSNNAGMMDWGRGVWPYRTNWVWGSGQGLQNHQRIGLNIGELSVASSAQATEDSLTVDEKLVKLGTVKCEYTNYTSPFKFYTINREPHSSYAAANVTFFPDDFYSKKVNFGVVKSELNQVFGRFVGNVTSIEGNYAVNVRGIVEVHRKRF